MKIRNHIFPVIATLLAIIVLNKNASAQQYKVHQVTSMTDMRYETTVYVKGMRKRTESSGFAGMPNHLVTIEQCDLQRTVTLNDKKKLYFIDPFSKETAGSEEKASSKNKPTATPVNAASQQGGTVTMSYSIVDTGERKKMYGLTARHIWTTQKITPSADACMKDSMIIKTDGWYIDLPQFDCPVRYAVANTGGWGTAAGCKDKFVTKMSGKGKLGFPLIEKRTMIMGKGAAGKNSFETALETVDFSTGKLDSMLFEIPAGYTQAKNLEELQNQQDYASLQQPYSNQEAAYSKPLNPAEPKRAGVLRIGVLEPASMEGVKASKLHTYLVNTLNADKVEAVAVASAAEAKKYNCDLLLTSKLMQAKGANKLGSVLKAVKNAQIPSGTAYHIEANLVLSNVSDGSTRLQKSVSRKYEGTADDAAKQALEEGSQQLLKELN